MDYDRPGIGALAARDGAPRQRDAAAGRVTRTRPRSGPRRGAAADFDSTLSDYVVSVYSQHARGQHGLPAPAVQGVLQPGLLRGGAVVASNVGFAGSSVISFSDLLGNPQHPGDPEPVPGT
jgi:hypothetical protein